MNFGGILNEIHQKPDKGHFHFVIHCYIWAFTFNNKKLDIHIRNKYFLLTIDQNRENIHLLYFRTFCMLKYAALRRKYLC